MILTVDGQWAHSFLPGDTVEMTEAAAAARLFASRQSFFDVMRDKLHWGVRIDRGARLMLRHLRVTNFAILSDVEIELGAGMNVLTGETGAGKSLIVEAVNLLRGGRASADIPRAGADEAVVEAIVEVPDDLRARVAERARGRGPAARRRATRSSSAA